jgi:hypothetical protein
VPAFFAQSAPKQRLNDSLPADVEAGCPFIELAQHSLR